MSKQWVWGEALQWRCAGSLGNKNILANSLTPRKQAAKTYMWDSFWLSRLRQRPLWGPLIKVYKILSGVERVGGGEPLTVSSNARGNDC